MAVPTGDWPGVEPPGRAEGKPGWKGSGPAVGLPESFPSFPSNVRLASSLQSGD